jgi:hypothetical protein
MLGKMAGMFGGKSMREGVVSSVAVKGDRMMTVTGDDAELVDLREEKIYNIDLKKKTYTVMTFEEMRQKIREARQKAEEQMAKQKEESAKQQKSGEEPQFDVDFSMKDTGQRKAVAGYDCHEVLMTVAVKPKGQTVEQGGGLVMEASSWLAPDVPAYKERLEFDRKFFQKVYGEAFSEADRQQMMSAIAMYPGMSQAIERMKKEQVNMSGTPLLTTTTMQSVVGAQQAAANKEQQDQKAEPESNTPPTSMGGLMGGFAKKMMKKKEQPPADQGAQGSAPKDPNRATIMRSTTETIEISTSVSPSDVEIPAGFKQEK